MVNVSRRDFFGFLGAGAASVALPGCLCRPSGEPVRAQIALQLYSINRAIQNQRVAGATRPDLAQILDQVAVLGFKGVEFAGYYDYRANELRKMLADAGLKACGTHVHNGQYGFNTQTWTFDPDVLKKTCEFNLGFGNNLIVCPGGGNFPPGCSWSTGRGGEPCPPSPAIDDFAKRLVDLYNQGAAVAAKYGCQLGLHNHTWEHTVFLQNGTSFWDYFFSHTDEKVCMEQDVGWSTCAGVDPCEQYVKYPHRSPTLHAKENGMGKDVKEFDAILGKPGRPGATPVDWDRLIRASEKDHVQWYVIECERHFEDYSAILPSYRFLKAKGLN